MKQRLTALSLVFSLMAVAALFGCNSGKDAEWEKKQKAAIEQFAAQSNGTFKYGSVEVKGSDESFLMKDVTGQIKVNTPDGKHISTIEYTIGEVKAAGVNFVDEVKPGKMDFAKSVTFTNLKAKNIFSNELAGMKDMASFDMTSKTSVAEMTLNEVKGDFSTFKALLTNPLLKASDLHGLLDFSVASSSLKDYESESAFPDMRGMNFGGELRFNILKTVQKTGSSKAMSADGIFDTLGSGYTVFINDKEVATIEKSEMKKLVFPGFFKALAEAKQPSDINFAGMEMVIEGVSVAGVKMTVENVGTLTLKNFGFSLSKKADQFAFKMTTDQFEVPTEFVDKVTGPMVLGPLKLETVYNKPLSLSSDIDVSYGMEGQKAVLDIKQASITENNLGSYSFAGKLFEDGAKVDPETGFPLMVNPLLAKASVHMKDSGLLDLAFKISSVLQSGSTADIESGAKNARQAASAGLTFVCSQVAPAFTSTCSDLSKYVAESGEFELAIEPANPLSLKKLDPQRMNDLDQKALGLTWKYTKK